MSTSPNCKALLAITAHWTSSTYKALATLLAIRELNENHISENMVEIIYQVAKEYEILDKLNYFMMNNVSNNNTTLMELNLLIQNDGGIEFNPVERRLRCFGYIMNLVIKDLLYEPKKKKRKQRQNEDIDEDEDEDMELIDVSEGKERENEKIEAERRH